MPAFLITYDLNSPGQDYSKLHDAIKAQSSENLWWHYLDSTWIIVSNGTAGSVRDALMATIDTNDKLLVIKVGPGGWGTANMPEKANQWLKNNV